MIFEHRFFRALTDTEAFVVGFLDRSILVDIVQAQIEFIVVLFTATYADTVIMHKGRMRNLVHPIGGNIPIDKAQIDGNAPYCVQLLLIVVPFRARHQIEVIQYFVHTPIRVERNGGFSSGAFFRSDKDYAVRAAGTVNSGSGSVFKHLHRLYIRCVQVVYIRHWHPIHDEQWFRVVYRTDTSDTDRGGGTRRTGAGSNGYTGSQAL